MSAKIIIIIPSVLLMIIVGIWIYDSLNYGEFLVFSREKKAVVKETVDELFGTEIKITEWTDGFWLGLLPGEDKFNINILLGVIPLSAIVIIGSLIIFFFLRKKTKEGVLK